jgi:excisionase family DNA binding protein
VSGLRRDLSPQEVADLTGLSRSLIYREIERGNLVAYKRGSRIRIEPQALVNWKQAACILPRGRDPVYKPCRASRPDPPGSRFTDDLEAIPAERAA